MQDMIKMIADYMVETGTQSTSSGSWIFDFYELHDKFGISKIWLHESFLSLIAELYSHEAVCDVLYDTNDWTFDINFFLDFCPNADEAGEFEY